MTDDSAQNLVTCDIERWMEPFLDSAFARFRYVQKDCAVTRSPERLIFSGVSDLKAASREFTYLLYREKILQETLQMRRQFFDAVCGK